MDGTPYLRIRPGRDEGRVEDPVRHVATLRSVPVKRWVRERDVVDRSGAVIVSQRSTKPIEFAGADGTVLGLGWWPYGRVTRPQVMRDAQSLELFIGADDPRRLLVIANWLALYNGFPQEYASD